LLSDDWLLRLFFDKSERVKLADVKRSVLLKERKLDTRIPDHYYRLGNKQTFEGISQLSELFTKGLKRLSDNFLEVRDEKVYVIAEKQNQWQMLLPQMPPLLLVAISLWSRYPYLSHQDMDYTIQYLKPNLQYTALPSPYLPRMEDMKNHGGCSDLHLHLNGSLEVDMAWDDFLSNPMEIREELYKAFENEKVKEQYSQFSSTWTPDEYYHLLKIAAVLREIIYSLLYKTEHVLLKKDDSLNKLLARIKREAINSPVNPHPEFLLSSTKTSPLCQEGLFYVKVLHYLSLHPDNDTISNLFLYYLCILGLCNRMLVHQTTSFGFEEFQKITLNGFREYGERLYNRRFLQMSGNELKNIKYVEGRFSPKNSKKKNEAMICSIRDGWKLLTDRQEKLGIPPSKLNLVAHFIKKADTRPNEFVRHRDLRHELSIRADLLESMRQDNSDYAQMVTGVDAAASEFDTPPEVFASVYRHFRGVGFKHFTYHAGEDFYHVLSGLRAIFEAIEFLALRQTDRIGHAVAAGVPIDLWYQNVGRHILIAQGEWLDNLIFAYYLITSENATKLLHLLPLLQLKIEKYGYEVYHQNIPLTLHVDAWLSRYRDPKDVMAEEDIFKNGLGKDEVFLLYHSRAVTEQYEKIISVDIFELFGENELIQLQQLLLAYMHRKEIVIETLPTSNVMIGNHHRFGTYHLYTWYKWKKAGLPLPPIVIGSDDTGIFATNIYNEYCNIYCQFLYEKKMNPEEIMAFIRELDENARLYAFCH
jgi:adenosine deaminase